MERLFYSILIGALIGVGGAIWLPPHKAAVFSELWDTVQAKAQAIYPSRPAVALGESEELQLPGAPTAPLPTTRPLNWPGGRSDAPRSQLKSESGVRQIGYDEPGSADAPPAPAYPRTATPDGVSANSTTGDGRGASTPNWNYPRGDENTVRGVEINKFEGAQILARVGPDVVLANEVLPRVTRILAPYKGQMTKQQYEDQRMILMQKVLAGVTDTKTVLVDARRKIPKEAWPEIQKQIDREFESRQIKNMIEEYGVSSRAELVEKVTEYGSSLELEKRLFGEQTLSRQWIGQQVKKDEEVTHEECVAYYREHLADFEFPAEARWEEIMIRLSGFPTKGEAFRALAALGNRVLDGASFDEVAKAGSQGSTARKGGERDWTTKGSLKSQVLDSAIFSLPVGALSSILETEQGFHIIRVIERREAGRTSFEEAQVDIRKRIKDERAQAQIKKYLTRIKDQTTVTTIFDDPKGGEQLSTGPKSSDRKSR